MEDLHTAEELKFQAQVEEEAKKLGLLETEENVPSGTNSENTNSSEQKQPEREYSEVEKEQMALGWDPNKPNGVSAEEFKRVGQIIEAKRAASKRADAASREVQELRKTVKQLVEHTRKLDQASYKKALEELKEEKREKILLGDADGVEELDLKEQILRESQKTAETQLQEPTVEEELSEDTKAYVERNKSWLYGTSPEDIKMQVATQKFIEYLKITEPNITEPEAIKAIEENVKRNFSHRFENPNQDKPAAVMSSTSSSSSSKASPSLSVAERVQYEAIKKVDPSFTVDEYIKQLELIGSRS